MVVVPTFPCFAFIFVLLVLLAELSYDKLLLNHLNFFVEGLQMHRVKLVHMLEKDPGGGQGRTVKELHQRFHRHVNA